MGIEILKVQGGPNFIVKVDRESTDAYRFIYFTGGRHPYHDSIMNKSQFKAFVEGLLPEYNKLHYS